MDAHVERRLTHMRRREPHVFERRRADGTVLKTVGGPMPGDGYIMSFIDVTAERAAQDALATANAGLEMRVAERTAELIAANAGLERAAVELETARRQAEAATRDKTQFLAAASHDLLQPLHAARLFCAALSDDLSEGQRPLAANIDQPLGAADRLLRSLLDVSQLDAGGVRPDMTRFGVGELIEELVGGFRPAAHAKGLRLRAVPCSIEVETDMTLLRSIVQNYLSNAVRYTRTGSVLVGCRPRGAQLRVEVWDSGVGIPATEHERIFEAFHRGAGAGSGGDDGAGVGLGLAIVERTARLLGADLDMRSVPGRGSMFAVSVPIAAARTRDTVAEPIRPHTPPIRDTQLWARRVMCVDDDPRILQALAALLGGWGCEIFSAGDYAGAKALIDQEAVDLALIDYQLGRTTGHGETGLDLIEVLGARQPAAVAALVTANPSAKIAQRAARLGAQVLRKPVDALELRELVVRCAVAAE